MKAIRKYILGFFFAIFSLVTHSSKAVGFAAGPCVGLSGFYSSFSLRNKDQKEISMDNKALQIGLFAELDVWLLYAKLDGVFGLDWRRLPNKVDKHCFKHITLPLVIGVPLFDLLRPHIGLIFRMPTSDDIEFKGNALIDKYKEKVNSYVLGIGVKLGNVLVDLDFERAFSSVNIKSIDSLFVGNDEHYTLKQFTLRVGYNVLGLIGSAG